jgi:hypothetical protein
LHRLCRCKGDIDVAVRQAIRRRKIVGAHDPQLGLRESLSKRLRDTWPLARLMAVRERDGKGARALLSHESAAIERDGQAIGDVAKQRGELIGARRGHEPAAVAYDQRIAKELPKTREGIADRRLRHVQASGGLRRASLLEYRVQDNKPIQIERRQIYAHDDLYHEL